MYAAMIRTQAGSVELKFAVRIRIGALRKKTQRHTGKHRQRKVSLNHIMVAGSLATQTRRDARQDRYPGFFFFNSPSNECSGLGPGSGKSLSAPSCMGSGLRWPSWSVMELLPLWSRSSGSFEPFPRSASLRRWSLTLFPGIGCLSVSADDEL